MEKVLSRKEVVKEAKEDWRYLETEWTQEEYVADVLRALEDDGYILK